MFSSGVFEGNPEFLHTKNSGLSAVKGSSSARARLPSASSLRIRPSYYSKHHRLGRLATPWPSAIVENNGKETEVFTQNSDPPDDRAEPPDDAEETESERDILPSVRVIIKKLRRFLDERTDVVRTTAVSCLPERLRDSETLPHVTLKAIVSICRSIEDLGVAGVLPVRDKCKSIEFAELLLLRIRTEGTSWRRRRTMR